MGLYIKGRDLPKNCDECIAGYGGCCYLASPESDEICPEDPEMGRAEFCPLVYVPPHGRLIDANKIGLTDFEIIICQKGNPFKNALEMLLEKIENAPTVIPADPAEEG